jgi:cytochrome c
MVERKGNCSRTHRGLAGLLLAAVACAGAAGAQGLPPTHAQLVKEGHELAAKLCQSCHVIDEKAAGPVTAGVPALRGIANSPGQSAERIRNILINPHPPMPDVKLSYPEIDRLVAYIDSLRADAAGPPLVPRQDRGKPVYPDPT